MKRLFWLVIVFAPMIAKGQANGDYQSFQSGSWNDINSWEIFSGGLWTPAALAPTNANGVITIRAAHIIAVPAGFLVTIDQTTIAATGGLQIDATGTVTVANGAGNDLTITSGATLGVTGTLICNNSAVISGSTSTTTTFQSGSVYQHLYTTSQGIIPLATWDAASTLRVTGYTTFTTATAGGNWGQSFGNVEWNCTLQTANFTFAGFLTTVNGNLIVSATGAGPATLRFATTGTATVNVAGNFTVSGSTEIGFCTTGTGIVNVAGNYTQNLTAGYVRLVDGNAGVGTLNLTGNFDLQAGVLEESGTVATQGNINFIGAPGTVHTFTEAGTPTTTLASTLAYSVADDNELIAVGESQIAGVSAGNGSFFTLGANSILRVESTDAAGAIQTGGGQGAATGNLRVTTANRVFGAGSQIIYSGSAAQFMGNGQPTVAGITTIIDNAAGVTQVAASTLSISGNLTLQTGNLTVSNATLTLSGTTDLQAGSLLFTSIGNARTLTINGTVNLGGNIVVTSGTQNANVVFGGDVSGGGFVSFSGPNSNLTFNGTGNLTLPLSGATSLENLTNNRNGVVIISGNLTVTNTITITNGTVQTDGTLSVNNDITITAGNLDANGTVVLTDDLTLGVGTIFYFEDQSVTLNNLLTNNGGFFSSNSISSLNIAGTGILGTIAFDPGGNTLGSFVLNRTNGTDPLVTLNSALTVDGTFDLLDGIFLNASGLDFNNAVITRNSAASFGATSAIPTGTYDLFLTGGTMTTGVETQGLSLGNVSVTSSGTVTLGGAMPATGNVIINSGTFTSVANAISAVNFTNNGTTFNAPSSTLTIGGDLANNGAFVTNNGTVVFNGVSSISGSVNPTFQNITITGALTSPTTLNLTGNFTNDGVFNEGTGTVVFTNTANGTKTIGGTATTTFNNLTIQNNTADPDVSISGNVELQGALTLSITANLDADGAGAGVLTILSTADTPTADGRIATLLGTSTVTGNFTVQRYLSGEGRIYRYLASPVQGASVAGWQDDFIITGTFTDPSNPGGQICGITVNPVTPSLYFYNEATKAYVAYPSSGLASSNPLQVGRGYAAFVRECTNPTIIDVRGTMVNGVNSGNVNLPVTHTGAVTDYNNLVGNPYPSQIDWDLVTINGSVSPTIAIRDNGTGSFRYHTRGGAPVDLPNGVVATGQAFWVRTIAAGPTVTVTEASKSATTGNIFYRQRNGGDLLAIELTGSTQTHGDMAYVILHDSTSQDYDRFDAPKMNNYVDNPFKELLDLYTREISGKSLALNYLPSIPCGYALPLVAKDIKVGSFTFNFDQIGVLAAYNIILNDIFLNTSINVTENPTYAFTVTSDPASKSAERFVLNFSDQEAALDLLVDSEVAICGSSPAKVKVYNSQPGVLYFAQFQNSTVSDTLIGNGSDLELSVISSAMIVGNNTVNFKGIKACSNAMFSLTQSTTVVKNNNYTPAKIVSNGNTLTSNYTEGNQWFFNGEEITGATYQNYEANESGLYSLVVTVGGCTANTQMQFVVTGEEWSLTDKIQVYPNPFKNKFRVEIESEAPVKTRIYSAVGLMISEKLLDGQGTIKSYEFDLSGNTDGIYILHIQQGSRVEQLKIIKRK